MKTKASLVAESVRLKQWSQQIRECQNRPAGLTIDDWCSSRELQKLTTIIDFVVSARQY